MVAIVSLAIIVVCFVFNAVAKMNLYNQPNKSLWQEIDGVKILDPDAEGDGFMVKLI